MERDFLGLNWRSSSGEEGRDLWNDSGKKQWALQDLGKRNVNENNLNNSPAFLNLSTGYVFDTNFKPPQMNPNTMWKLPCMDIENPSTGVTNAPIVAAPIYNSPFQASSIVDKPSSISFVDELNFAKRNEGKADQLTILYANAVHVYNDISPHQVDVILRLAKTDQSVHTNAKKVIKPIPVKVLHNNQAWPPQFLASSLRSTATSPLRGTIPQARRATLRRFLEKRKERLRNSMCMKKPTICFDMELDMGSIPLALNDNNQSIQTKKLLH